MFLENSRYAKTPTVETTTTEGRPVRALKLRRLAVAVGEPRAVKENDRLDLYAQERYADARRFWHIADANSALDARTLVDEVGESLNIPAS